MEFNYTIDPSADEPIMLIDRHIGYDSEEGEGIMGDKFCRELMFLDTLNKSKINVWINSPGGVVTDSDQIIAAILKSKTKVDTHNIGMCASCAGGIFLAGRTRYMMDYAKFMIHGISGSNNNAQSKAFTDGILTNLTTRCKLDETTARQYMSTETWLNATQCEDLGIAIKEPSSDYNRPRKVSENAVEGWRDLKGVVNKLIENKKPHTMSNKVTNRLKLVDGADESMQLAAIEAIENRATTAEGKLVAQDVENKAKIEALNKQVETLTAEKTEAAKKVAEFEAEKAEALKVTNKVEITAMVNEAAKLGKIENKAEAITAFITKVENKSKDEVQALLDLIPSKVAGAVFNTGGTVSSYTVADINNRLAKQAAEKNKR